MLPNSGKIQISESKTQMIKQDQTNRPQSPASQESQSKTQETLQVIVQEESQSEQALNADEVSNLNIANSKGRRPKYHGAQYPQLIDQAKLVLPQHNYDIKKILEMEEFQPLKGSTDLPRFVNKFILNKKISRASKTEKAKSVVDAHKDNYLHQLNDPTHIDFDKPDIPFKSQGQLQSHNDMKTNLGQQLQNELTQAYLREFIMLKAEDRYSFLEQVHSRNSASLIDFLQKLKHTCTQSATKGLFRILQELLINLKPPMQIRTRIFLNSLLFYGYETIDFDIELLRSAMQLLTSKPDPQLCLGLASFIFINDASEFSSLNDDLQLLDTVNCDIIPLMQSLLSMLKVDSQVVHLLPNSLRILSRPFIQQLKHDSGLGIIRDVPIEVVQYHVQICALVQAKSVGQLEEFLNSMREIYINQWDYFDQIFFMYLMREISRTLVSSSTRWRNKLDEIQKVCQCIGTLLMERKDLKFKELIDEVLAGNMKQLELQKKLPKNASKFTQEQKATAFQQLQFLNKNSKEIESFVRRSVKDAFRAAQFQKQLEEHLGFELLPLQSLCFNYLMQCEASRTFINFGMGNGKTLMCICIAAYLAQSTQTPVFIVGKNDHLVLRDENTYQSTLTGMGLRVNVGEWDSKVGIYFLTQKDVEQFSQDNNFNDTWQRSSVVMDEHDWIMFDGSIHQMKTVIQLLQQSKKLVAFTGSVLNQKETTILTDIFGAKEVNFPSISSVISQRRIHFPDILVPSSLQDYTRQLVSILEQQTFKAPVVIVCQQSFPYIETILKKQPHLKIMIVKNLRGGRVEASLEGTLCLKNSSGRYGVFVLSEQQGRGTDLKSSKEIEGNGWLYLIVADVFTKRSHEQILGRVARLENKGQWHYMIYMHGCTDTIDQIVMLKQETKENENHIKLSRLSSELWQTTLFQEQLDQPRKINDAFSRSNSKVPTDQEQNFLNSNSLAQVEETIKAQGSSDSGKLLGQWEVSLNDNSLAQLDLKSNSEELKIDFLALNEEALESKILTQQAANKKVKKSQIFLSEVNGAQKSAQTLNIRTKRVTNCSAQSILGKRKKPSQEEIHQGFESAGVKEEIRQESPLKGQAHQGLD